MLVFSLRDRRGETYVDLFLEYPLAWDKLYGDSEVVTVNGVPIRVASLQHLTPPTDPPAAGPPSEAPDGEVAQLRDALRLSPGERLRLAEALWVFARATPHYHPKKPDQFRPR